MSGSSTVIAVQSAGRAGGAARGCAHDAAPRADVRRNQRATTKAREARDVTIPRDHNSAAGWSVVVVGFDAMNG
jgi:hypothetical protein